ncbi:MAG: RDD family protein [Sphaerochaetaceae bacterium]|nr:RDD family protein [Sphaerochaetaceae bacterium]
MIYDIQRGSLLKRASAFLLDIILIAIIAVGFAALFSYIFHYDNYSKTYTDKLEQYSKQYNVNFDISAAQYNSFTASERVNWDRAYKALIEDGEAIRSYNVMVWMIVSFTSVSILLSYLLLEFVLPLILKNGQTVGKKVFGLGVMRSNGVRIQAVSLFIRTFLGKCIIETTIPALIVTMIFLNTIGLVGPVIIGIILIVNICFILFTRNRNMIHDYISDCVVVDLASQLIFDSEAELIEYKKKVAAEQSANSEY